MNLGLALHDAKPPRKPGAKATAVVAVAELKHRLSVLERDLESCGQARDVYRKDALQAQQDVDAAQRALGECRAECQRLEATNEELKGVIVDLDAELRQLQHRAVSERRTKDRDSTRLVQHTADVVTQWKAEVERLKEEHLKERVRWEAHVARLEEQVGELQERVPSASHERVIAELGELQLERSRLQRRCDDLHTRNHELQVEKDEILQKNWQNLARLREIQQERDELRDEVSRLRRRTDVHVAPRPRENDGPLELSHLSDEPRQPRRERRERREHGTYTHSLDADRESHFLHRQSSHGGGRSRPLDKIARSISELVEQAREEAPTEARPRAPPPRTPAPARTSPRLDESKRRLREFEQLFELETVGEQAGGGEHNLELQSALTNALAENEALRARVAASVEAEDRTRENYTELMRRHLDTMKQLEVETGRLDKLQQLQSDTLRRAKDNHS